MSTALGLIREMKMSRFFRLTLILSRSLYLVCKTKPVVNLSSPSKLKGSLALKLSCVDSVLVPSLFMSSDRSSRQGDMTTLVARNQRVCICALVSVTDR